jgi:hypothetical protein
VIDPGTARKFNSAVVASMTNCSSLMEELDANGLLLTGDRHDGLVATYIREMIRQMEGRTASGIMRERYGRDQGSPEEMYAAMLTLMRLYAASTF